MTVEERIAKLEAAVDDLRSAGKPGQIRSMAHTHRCPACGGGSLFHFRRVTDRGHMDLNDFALQKESGLWGIKLSAGALEAYACRTCRLVEWHAISLDDVKPDGDTVIEIETPPDTTVPRGVYR